MENKKINAFNKPIIEWDAPEYYEHQKDAKWVILVGFLFVLLCAYAVLTGNWTLFIALIAFAGVYYWQHFVAPQHIKIIVSKVGIKVGRREYPYQNIDSFWVNYRPPHVKTLNIRSGSKFLPDIVIQLGEQDPAELREYLASQIHELTGREETFVEGVIRLLKL